MAQAPGYLAGGPNQYYGGTITPPKGEPPMKAYKDWNTAWKVTATTVLGGHRAGDLLPGGVHAAALAVRHQQRSGDQGGGPHPLAAAGTFAGQVPVEITCATPAASIRYTLDGSTPSSTQGTLYTAPVVLPVGTTTLKACAYKSGMLDSNVSSGTYTVLSAALRPDPQPVAGCGRQSRPRPCRLAPRPPAPRPWTQPLETPQNFADQYAQQFVGYLVAPTTGAYTFWIAGADACDIYLSTTDQAANKVKIAYLRLGSGWRQWTANATQKSAPINLVAGQRYYFEVLQKEENGSDHLSVGWAKPGQSTLCPVNSCRQPCCCPLTHNAASV